MNVTETTSLIRVTDLLRDLEKRRKELGMPMSALALRAGVGHRTVQRILSGEASDANLQTVAALAAALGASLDARETTNARTLRRDAAVRKAKRLAALVQGTSALEDQAVGRHVLEEIEERIMHELLAGPKSRLWND